MTAVWKVLFIIGGNGLSIGREKPLSCPKYFRDLTPSEFYLRRF
jgi:hypothetical protein